MLILFIRTVSGPIPACAGQPANTKLSRMPSRAYPRVCGATGLCCFLSPGCWGLSPRVRGNRGVHSTLPGLPRPIPACAGQPTPSPAGAWTPGAYPRVCGATDKRPCPTTGFVGLSPRVRGNRELLNFLAIAGGPIPACAGQPLSSRFIFCNIWAYPRVCGATATIPMPVRLETGLSPRVRGNRTQSNNALRRGGPIPACAGQPHGVCSLKLKIRAYPRVCGATRSSSPRLTSA